MLGWTSPRRIAFYKFRYCLRFLLLDLVCCAFDRFCLQIRTPVYPHRRGNTRQELREGPPSRKLVAAAAFAGCFVLIAAAQVIPAEELGRLSLRWVNAPSPVPWDEVVPFTVHNEFSLHPLGSSTW